MPDFCDVRTGDCVSGDAADTKELKSHTTFSSRNRERKDGTALSTTVVEFRPGRGLGTPTFFFVSKQQELIVQWGGQQ